MHGHRIELDAQEKIQGLPKKEGWYIVIYTDGGFQKSWFNGFRFEWINDDYFKSRVPISEEKIRSWIEII